MIPSDGRTRDETAASEPTPPPRRTLPPPEWSTPLRGEPPSRVRIAAPLLRRTGARADEAWLRARVEAARAAENAASLRDACAALARWLASRDRDLDEAVDLAGYALEIGEDVELRRELSAWLESLGESARAAAVLKPIASLPDVEAAEAAYALVRTGLLRARAGAAAAAAAAFEAALAVDSVDAHAGELLGSLSAWEPEAVPREAAVAAYIEAARRRAAQRQYDAELEDLWRAFATDPASDAGALALAGALEARGRGAAADAVWRAHAKALAPVDPGASTRVLAGRREEAATAGDPLRALGFALHERLDQRLEGEGSAAFDTILLDLGMLEVLAARLELRAERATAPSDRAAHWLELVRLLSGPLADEERARVAAARYVAALASEPSYEHALAVLRASNIDAIAGLRVVGRSGVGIEGADGGGSPRPAATRAAFPVGAEHGAAAAAWVRASVEGGLRAQAGALERVSSFESGSVGSVLLSAAADRHLALGDAGLARRSAELATRADPAGAHGVAVLADALSHVRTEPSESVESPFAEAARAGPDVWVAALRRAAAALERAVETIGPRLDWCVALADVLDTLGETEPCVRWTHRCLALCPCDRRLTELLLDRLVHAADPGRLRDALSWLLAQPRPARWAATPLSRALIELGKLDPGRAVVVARRALDVFGPKFASLREAMLAVSSSASDDAFAIAILERWLSCGAEGADRRELLVRLAELRERVGDDEGVARITARAVRESLRAPEIDARIEHPPEGKATPDAIVWRLRVSAERLASGDDDDAAAVAWRDLGAALWDLADDRVGAVGAWLRAARIAGYSTLALDLVAFGGASFAFAYLARVVETEPDDAAAAGIAVEVARAALSVGEAAFAFDLSARGLARRPGCVEALDAAEEAAHRAGEGPALSALYDLVAVRSLGRFGRRATHYRGARFFERTGDCAFSLKHATQAFLAVPSEGSTFSFLARAAERADDRSNAIRAVEQVAEAEARSAHRAAWLLRAARLADESDDGERRRIDILLSACLACPSLDTIAGLAEAAGRLLARCPEEKESLRLRIGHAAETIGERVDGPEGARVAVAFATMALALLGNADVAFTCLELAHRCDAEVDDFDQLIPHAFALSLAPSVRERLSAMLAVVERKDVGVGPSALRLFAAVADAAGDLASRGRSLLAATALAPDDDAILVAAEEMVRAVPELRDALARAAPPGRRAAALVQEARARVACGAHSEAALLFETAIDLLEGESRVAIESELHAADEAAGRLSQIEARALRKASNADAPSARADGWAEVGSIRERQGDLRGAVEALREACRLSGGPLERWSALERVAERAGDDAARVEALEQIRARVNEEGLPTVLKRLARAHERRGDWASAERAWQEVLASDPEDEEADHGIESSIVAANDYGRLVDHLARRAECLGRRPLERELLRAVRLRRAAILEQRLGRTADACQELERLLSDWPDHVGALRYLADLYDRQADYSRSLLLWRRAATIEESEGGRDGLGSRPANPAFAADGVAPVRDKTDRSPAGGADREALEVRHVAARALGADADVADALDAMSEQERDDERRVEMLVESAKASERAGDLSRALDRARRASGYAGDLAGPRLLLRKIEYRVRGAGAPDEARQTIEELTRIGGPLANDDAALRAFLLAEALDVVSGGGAGTRELEAARATVGHHALLAVGLAERLTAQGQYPAAVGAYRAAVNGPLLELRRLGALAMSGAEAALLAGSHEDALYFLGIADTCEDAKPAALALRERLSRPPDSIEAVGDVRLYDLEAAVQTAVDTQERARARLALARGRLDFGDARGAEPLLREALADGLAEAGDVLAPLLAASPDRIPELVRVRWQLVVLEPGDLERLESLRVAALADGDRVHARAVEHVIRALDPGAGPLPPPPLSVQLEQPGILALLTRPSMDAAGEAFALLWEGAMDLFVRDPAGYGISGVERLVPGPSSAISRVYDATLRVLGVPRIPLFASRSPALAVSSHPALLSPASVIMAGDLREETAELRYELGRGVSAALPHNILRRALPVEEGRAVFDALRAAFGPPERAGRTVDPRTARLAESFWQVMPPRAQRRLQELLRMSLADYGELEEASQQSGRRVGMFLAGDFACAVRAVLAESMRVIGPPTPDRLRELCSSVPAIADLLRLAVSREYADARFHPVAAVAQRRPASSGRFNLF
jgi:hypothetical protein